MIALIAAMLIDAEAICTRSAAKQLSAAATAAAQSCDDTEADHMCWTVLAEKFAARRDYDAAEWFLCLAVENEISEAEAEGMFEHLGRMRSGNEKRPLDFCDHTTSGYGDTYCAHQEYSRKVPKLEARIPKPLAKTVEAYAIAEAARIAAPSLGGTGYGASILRSEIVAKETIVQSLDRHWKKRAPAADAKKADADLNAAYREAQQHFDEESLADWKTILRDAQRAWIAYRDAVAAHYVERWRGAADPAALRREIVAQLSRERAAELRRR